MATSEPETAVSRRFLGWFDLLEVVGVAVDAFQVLDAVDVGPRL
jgi:hypothetical protein